MTFEENVIARLEALQESVDDLHDSLTEEIDALAPEEKPFTSPPPEPITLEEAQRWVKAGHPSWGRKVTVEFTDDGPVAVFRVPPQTPFGPFTEERRKLEAL